MKNKFLTVILIAFSLVHFGNNFVLVADSVDDVPYGEVSYSATLYDSACENEVCDGVACRNTVCADSVKYTDLENGRWAVVALSSIYMRALPDYESALETQELMGRVVKIVDESSYWRKIESDQPYTAWCTEKGIVEMSAASIKEYADAPKLIVTALYSHVYTSPSEKSQPITDLVCGDILRYADHNNVTYAQKVKKHSSRKWVNVLLPTGETGWVKKSDVVDLDKWVMAADDCADNIVATAKQFVGVPYLWGGMSSKGFDCSGLVRIVYMMNGVLLPRNASQQIYCGQKIDVCEEHEDFAKNIAETVKNLIPGVHEQ